MSGWRAVRHDSRVADFSPNDDGLSGTAKRLRIKPARYRCADYHVYRGATDWEGLEQNFDHRWFRVVGDFVILAGTYQFADFRVERHLAERAEWYCHQFYFRGVDDIGDGALAPGADGQCDGHLQFDAQPRRQLRHR